MKLCRPSGASESLMSGKLAIAGKGREAYRPQNPDFAADSTLGSRWEPQEGTMRLRRVQAPWPRCSGPVQSDLAPPSSTP